MELGGGVGPVDSSRVEVLVVNIFFRCYFCFRSPMRKCFQSLYHVFHSDTEEERRNSHLFFTLHVYQYQVDKCGKGGGK